MIVLSTKAIRCYLHILTIILVTSISNAQQIGFPFIRNYSPQEYKGHPQVFFIMQDKNTGIMYFDGGDKILQYDGVEWSEIPVLSGLYAMAQHNNGTIYVAAIEQFGYLHVSNNGKIEYNSLPPLLADTSTKVGVVISVKCTTKEVFFQTYDAIFQYFPDKNTINVIKADTNGRFNEGFIHNDAYYVRLSKRGLMKVENNELKQAANGDALKNKLKFREAVSYDTNTILLPSNREGVYLHSLLPNTNLKPLELSDASFISNNSIYCTYKADNNLFLLGSIKKGVIMINNKGKVLQHYNENNLLQNNGLLAVQSDMNKNFWFGLDIGITKTEHSLDWSYWNKYAGIKGSIESIIRFGNKIYVATVQGSYCLDENNQVHEIKNIPASQNWCFRTFSTANDTLLLTGTQFGIYQIADTVTHSIYQGSHAYTLYQSKLHKQRLYATDGFSAFISLQYNNGKWKSDGTWENIEEEVRNILEQDDGTLWLSTYSNGVIKVIPDFDNITTPKKVQYYTEKEGLPKLDFCTIWQYKQKIVASTDSGMYQYNRETDKFEPWCELGDTFCNGNRSIYRFSQATDGKIYISSYNNTQGDVGYLQPADNGSYQWIYKPFRRMPFLASIASIYPESNGVVWIGSSEGLFRYAATMDSKNYDQPFRCIIRQVAITGDSILYYGNIYNNSNYPQTTVSYSLNHVHFRFAAPFFDNEEKTLYSFILEGEDTSWSAWSNQTEKEYTNLWEGQYTFKVKAKNIYDIESSTDVFRVTIEPPYYRTWWAYCIYIALIAILLFFFINAYTRRLIKQKQHLEKIVQERTLQIIEKNEELNQTNEELKTTLDKLSETIGQLNQANEELTTTLEVVNNQKSQIIQQKELFEKSHDQTSASINYAKRIQQAVLPTNETLSGMFREYFLLFRPRNVVSGDFYYAYSSGSKTIITVADCTGHGVPGAFMSMLGITLLNDIVRKNTFSGASQILNQLRYELKQALQQTGAPGEQQDGMDVAFCLFDTETMTMNFAGAYNPCWVFRPSQQDTTRYEIIELQPDRQPVGVYMKELPFSEQTIQIQTNDVFYLFTDGYYSQFGGESILPMRTKQLKLILSEICRLPMQQQLQTLENRFEQWKSKEEQTDDVLLMGIRIT